MASWPHCYFHIFCPSVSETPGSPDIALPCLRAFVCMRSHIRCGCACHCTLIKYGVSSDNLGFLTVLVLTLSEYGFVFEKTVLALKHRKTRLDILCTRKTLGYVFPKVRVMDSQVGNVGSRRMDPVGPAGRPVGSGGVGRVGLGKCGGWVWSCSPSIT